MPPDLRHEIERAALLHGRTLTSEINLRLRHSLNAGAPDIASAAHLARTGEEVPPYVRERQPRPPGLPLSMTDRTLLDLFHRLTLEKQAALIELLR